MPIDFSCPECNTVIRTPDATAGKKGKCPECLAIVRIPGGTALAVPKPAAPAPSKPVAPAPPAAPPPAVESAETGPLEFFCSVCGQIVRTPRSAAGKKGKCPHCQGVIQIPLKSRSVKSNPRKTDVPAAPAPVQPVAQPKPSPKPTPKPAKPKVEDVGLAPLDDLSSLDDLTPLDDPQPKRKDNNEFIAPQVVHKPKNPNIPPSESFLKPMGDDLDDLLSGSDPFAVGGFKVAADPLAPAGGGGGISLPSASAFAPTTPSYSSAPPNLAAGGPVSPMMVFLPALFQILAIIPFMLFNMFTIAASVHFFLVANAEGGLTTEGTTRLVLFGMFLLIVFAIQIWAIFGSIGMMQYRNYENAIASAWISIIPCFGFLGIPFGIWSLIVLRDRRVKKLFKDD